MPSIKCYCDEVIGATLRPIPLGLSIFRDTALVEATGRVAELVEASPLSDLIGEITVETLDFGNPAHRLAVQCENCGRILVTGDTWSAVQVFRHEVDSVPVARAGRGSTGLFASWEPPAGEDSPAREVTCPCGNGLEELERPRPRGVVLFSAETSWVMADVLHNAIEAGASRSEVSELVGQFLDPGNPAFRYAVQCERCTRMLVLNDSNQIVDVFIEHPDDVPPDKTGRGSKGFFQD